MHRFRLGFLAVLSFTIGCHHHRVYDISDRRGLEHMRFSAGSALGGAGDTLLVRVLVTNESSHDQGLVVSVCGTGPVAVSARRARRVWDSNAWGRTSTPSYPDSTGHVAFIGLICSGVVGILVPPGVSRNYDCRVPVRDILGDSLQSGRYKITARIYINNREVKGLPAGEVDLRLKPRPEGSTS